MPGFKHQGRHLGPLGLGLLFIFPDLVWSSGVRVPICFRQGPLAAVGTRLALLSTDRSIREFMCYRTFRRAKELSEGLQKRQQVRLPGMTQKTNPPRELPLWHPAEVLVSGGFSVREPLPPGTEHPIDK